MDFVVFGIGTGAALVLIGWLGRDLGPRLRDRAPRDDDAVLSVEELVARVSWSRFCGSLGAAMALCGAVLLLATITALVLRVSDETGSIVMLATFALILVAMTAWSWAYVRRFGVYGVVRRPRPELAPAPAVMATPADASVLPETSDALTDPSTTPEPVAADMATDMPPVVPAAGGGEIAEPLAAEGGTVPESAELAPPSAEPTGDGDVPSDGTEMTSGSNADVPGEATAAPAASEADEESVPASGGTEKAASNGFNGAEQPPESAAGEGVAGASANGEETFADPNGNPAPEGEKTSMRDPSETLAATPSQPVVSEGLVDPSPAVPRAARRRRTMSERHGYLERARPPAATRPDRGSADAPRAEGKA